MAKKDSAQAQSEQASEAKPGPLVVGIGASAGGLAALKTFFSHVPDNSGLAYVVVVHLAPERESYLSDLLQPHANIPVHQVKDTVPLESDRIYVIPPNANLNSIDTHLRLTQLEQRRQERAPIDHFFRTLARTHEGRAIGVILTGTGSDGALGIKEIKERHGLTVVQEPAEAEYDGMPQSAIATGLVDLVLPLAHIPAAIISFARTAPRLPLLEEGEDLEDTSRQFLQRIFAHVRARTGRDFTRYKRSTTLRRIARRMQIRHIEELASYLALLRSEPEEAHTLADDLLITVTSFFRDPAVFKMLQEKVVPRLFEDKEAGDTIRVWSVGCATGEEAYSLAMLLQEESSRREIFPRLQIFASDLHEPSLKRAREGFFPGEIATDVTHDRLRRFFVKEDGNYRIRKELREMVVFAPHNLLADPPFSRLDLISCRNLLIYLNRDVQTEVISLFHYALRADGFLVLGGSETVEGSQLFVPEDKKLCVFHKRNVPAPHVRLPVFPLSRPRRLDEPHHSGGPVSYSVLHQRMVERHSPPSLLLTPEDQVVHVSPQAGRYLVHPSGEITTHVFKLLREELRMELRAALHVARESNTFVRSKPVPVPSVTKGLNVVVQIQPAPEPVHTGFALVLFEEEQSASANAPPVPAETSDRSAAKLDDEIQLSRQRVQAVIEEYETSQEEMRASNEELQSTNEELRSTMEELETSKEELQSLNEELQTVNQENRHKVEELAQLSSDLQNLLAATDIATLFLDRELRIMRFTPKVGGLFNVRTTDRGRPISDLTHRLGYPELQEDAQEVLDRLVPIEREVQDDAGRWYIARVLPYRSAEERIAGVVITFVDITRRKEAEASMRLVAEALRAKTAELQEEDKRREQFLATVGHEIRNPLAAIDSAVRLVERGAHPADGLLGLISNHVAQLKNLVNDLLDLSRLTRGRIELRRARTDLTAVVHSAVRTVELSVDNKHQELSVSVEPDLHVEGDATRLEQVVVNLLTNAMKFTRERGCISVSLRREGDAAVLVVADQGRGIAPERLVTIFEPFKGGGVGGGLGLGLALVKTMVELHGGTIEAASEGRGRGSCFTVRLPVGNVLDTTLAEPRPEPPVDRFAEPLRVLIVDDARDSADMLALLLQSTGAETECAYTGGEGIEKAKSWTPDAVLVDIGLPDVTGYDVARAIRNDGGRNLLLLAVTGFGEPAMECDPQEAGFDDWLVKPVDHTRLHRLLSRHIERRSRL